VSAGQEPGIVKLTEQRDGFSEAGRAMILERYRDQRAPPEHRRGRFDPA
jgi:hypothetical protein